MDTRIKTTTIVDYKNFYGVDSINFDASELIAGIPSIALIHYISFFNAQIYLKDQPEDYKTQISLIQTLTKQAGESTQEQLASTFSKYRESGQLPIIIWNYSNLKFYDIIFSNYNTYPARELSAGEIKNIFEAYLIINCITDEKFILPEEQLQRLANGQGIEEFTIAKFMYQKDYFSSTEIQNQLTRGYYMFNFLEKSDMFKAGVTAYYRQLGVHNYTQMGGAVYATFVNVYNQGKENTNLHIVDLSDFSAFLNFNFLDKLSINSSISSYSSDLNFTALRETPLYKVEPMKYIILDFNFFVNHLYKAQIFSLKNHFAITGVSNNFLSLKAKDFMEDVYFKEIIQRCFSSSILYFGDTARISKSNELCDCYLRNDSQIATIELKDVLFSAEIKDNSDILAITKEIEKKFLSNQFGKAKGVGQLFNGLDLLNTLKIPFDTTCNSVKLTIYPIIVYTDNAFSIDGFNKLLSERLGAELATTEYANLDVRPLTVISLHFFEIFEDYFKNKSIDLFNLINQYHAHVSIPDFHLTPFDTFAKMYIEKEMPEAKAPPSLFNEISKVVFTAMFSLINLDSEPADNNPI